MNIFERFFLNFLMIVIAVSVFVALVPTFFLKHVDSARAEAVTFIVDTTADGAANAARCEENASSGNDCTLRDALTAANATTTPTSILITFSVTTTDANYYCYSSTSTEINIATSGSDNCSGSTRWWKIRPTSALPAITNSLGVTVNGYSASGAAENTVSAGTDAVLKIEIDGTSAGESVNGFSVNAPSATVKGMAVNRFTDTGFDVNASSTIIRGNYIGTDITGLIDYGNTANGINLNDGAGTTVGGAAVAARNVISGNGTSGVLISGSGAINNYVLGNYIGVNASGSGSISNGSTGISVTSEATGNTIGGTTSAARNVISGNSSAGLVVSANSTTVQGNYIGTNAAGTAAIGNSQNGVSVSSNSNTIGGTDTGSGNVISGNSANVGVGILFTGTASSNSVMGNYIGVNASGTAAIANYIGVETLSGPFGNTIGGSSSEARNIISGNTTTGVEIKTSSNSNTISGNYIGLNAAGDAAIANSNGIIVNASSSTTIGGATSAYANIISGNSSNGISMIAATSTVVSANIIGQNAAGTAVVANSIGMTLSSTSNSTIGGDSTAEGNVIRGNSSYGINCTGTGSSNTFQYNIAYSNVADQVYMNSGCTGNTFSDNTVGNSTVVTTVSSTLVTSLTTFSAGGNAYNSCIDLSSPCLFYYDTSLSGDPLVPISADNTTLTITNTYNNFNLWLGTFSDIPGGRYSVLVRDDQLNSAAAVALYLTNNLGAGTATTGYFESDVLTPGATPYDSYVFKGISNFSDSAISITDGSTSPLSLAATLRYGYNVVGMSNSFSNETCLNIANCFLFAPTSAASFTVSSSTLTSVTNLGFKTSGSYAVNLTIQDTIVTSTLISHGATSGTTYKKFNTRARVLDSFGQPVGDAEVEIVNSSALLANLTTDATGHTSYIALPVFAATYGTSSTDPNLTATASKRGQSNTDSTYALDSANETVTITFPAVVSGAMPGTYTSPVPTLNEKYIENNKGDKEKSDLLLIPLQNKTDTILEDGMLIKYPHSAKVYFLDKERKRHILNEQVFFENGFNGLDIKIISPETQFIDGPALINKLQAVIGHPLDKLLKQGQSGSSVRLLQDVLRRAGYFNMSSTGYFGPVTARAVRQFQIDHDLSPVGFVGPKTRSLLNLFLEIKK